MKTNEDLGDEVDYSEFPPGMASKILNLLSNITNLETKLQPLLSNTRQEIAGKVSFFYQKNLIKLTLNTIILLT